jgi:hypothetical protein
MDKHRMWTHGVRGGVYEVLGGAVYKGTEALKDMALVVVTRNGEGWADMDVQPEHYTIKLGSLVDAGTAQVEKGATIKHGAELIVYRDEVAKVWVRPIKDFYDGRFTKLDDDLKPLAPPKPMIEDPKPNQLPLGMVRSDGDGA